MDNDDCEDSATGYHHPNNNFARNKNVTRKTRGKPSSGERFGRYAINQRFQIPRASRIQRNSANEGHSDIAAVNESSTATGHKKPHSKRKYVGFHFLNEISQADSKQIIISINESRDAFIQLLQSSIEKLDMYVLIIKIAAKLCDSSFDQLKSNLLLEICNSKFISNLRNYLMDLPDTQTKKNMYWKNQTEFWTNFISFCDYIIKTYPSVAIDKCRSLIQDASKCCLEGLSKRHGFNLSQEHSSKLENLRKSLTIVMYEQESKTAQPKRVVQHDETGPPNDFRQLSVLPTQEDLLDGRPYLRPNIINGAYTDVEHYLDVQFRLLREDCFGPLREGIHKFLEDPNRKRIDNIRVYRNVKFVQPYVSKQKVGLVVQVDERTSKLFKKTNWAHNKRFIYGSLLLFSKDNCKTFTSATILDRDTKYLTHGMIPISIVNQAMSTEIDDVKDTFIMIESEVYFEPYLHVLKALQDPMFPQHIAMSKYIVHVNPEQQHPTYLNEESVFKIEKSQNDFFKFLVLNENSWPSSEEMGLNESQYEAYHLALTHEFAVIQGPPGTGKTFLGVKIAKTLLENLKTTQGCLLLLICYTNHALDQFLEAIVPITNSIVRIGGQSRNEAMENFNLNNIRRNRPKVNRITNNLYLEHRSNLKKVTMALTLLQEKMQLLRNDVISYRYIKQHIPDSRKLLEHYRTQKEPLMHWLFENMPLYEITFDENALKQDNVNDNDIFERNDIILDDLEEDDEEEICRNIRLSDVSSSFSVINAEAKFQRLLSRYFDPSVDQQTKEEITKQMTLESSRIKMYQDMSSLRSQATLVYNADRNPSHYSTEDRWKIYFGWANLVMNDLKEEMIFLEAELKAANAAYEESRMILDLELLRDIKVVGMTTSGAARLRKLLLALAPTIVIVEEAAEVFEQHIVTSLTKHCQHLILIGDHQQLRPSAAHMKLAKHFNLEVSLFERMIRNKMHSRQLCVQHRMRPEIAALISPHIYPDLINHPTVEDFPDVCGMCNNLFFFTHNFKEEVVDDSSSKANHQEADMVLHLANYLMQQGYEPSDVTILAAYSGQMFYLRKERKNYAHLAKVKITVVDNYQGEESKIILLSLVRNNNKGEIGFLRTENRVCVALSRAKEGFYIFGNIDTLKKDSELWSKIAETLNKNESIGTSLRLRCKIHQNQITTISSPKHFEKVPEGGCLLKCKFNLPKCGHQCPLICHSYDREHKVIRCIQECERLCEAQAHPCPLSCAEACRACAVPVRKQLPCGHASAVPCALDPADPSVRCHVDVPVTMPHCAHEAKKPCYVDVKYIRCPVNCDARLKCGHVCTRKCHVTNDPDHNNYFCHKPCAKAKKGCSLELEGDRGDHQCRNQCSETCDDCNVKIVKKRSTCKHTERVPCNKNIDEEPCRKNCARTLPCGHFCKKKCYEPCGGCRQQVKKKIPDCGHEVTVACSTEATRSMCRQACERRLACGHACRARCAQPCAPAKCLELLPRLYDSPCGHKVQLPCFAFASDPTGSAREALLSSCREPCGAQLACGHACGGGCGACRQGRLHAPCSQPCHQILICGHQCTEPCNQICPPCTKPCEVKCKHSKCKKCCGEPCVLCKEACSRRCPHGACRRRCGEACERAACERPCPRRLACAHRCRGLCGEPCPPVCDLCRPDDFPRDFLGDPFEHDDKFILLEDCNHVMELENMDNLMFGDKETVAIRACPFCRKPIINTHRYKDFVNDMFKKEINPIKEKVYGNAAQIEDKEKELQEKMSTFISKHPQIASDKNWRLAFDQLATKLKQNNKASLLQLEMDSIYLNILEMLADTYNIYVAANLTEFKTHVIHQIDIICKVLNKNTKKISQQQQKDIGNEIKRMNSIIQLAKIVSHPSYLYSKHSPKVKNAFVNAEAILTGWTAYNENVGVEALKLLQKAINVDNIVTKQERSLVVAAIGLKAGHWFKCPNGHFYCIGECGGAMQLSKCIECGAAIGGERHSLLSTNRHAPEIDGSTFAAWSEEYNNMGNFNLD